MTTATNHPGLEPLYRVDELSDGGGRILVCESQDLADAAISIGLTATAVPGGANRVRSTDLRPLLGFEEVVILVDNAGPGMKYICNLAQQLGAEKCAGHLTRAYPPGGQVGPGCWAKLLSINGRSAGDIREDVGRIIESNRRDQAASDAGAREGTGTLSQPDAGLVTVRASAIEPTTLEWLWPGRIPLGKTTIFASDPGLGKTFVALDIAARVSAGCPFADSQDVRNPAGGVVILSAEDDANDTIVPRLQAAAADLDRIVIVQGVKRFDPDSETYREGMFSLDTDLPRLEDAVKAERGCRLVIIDPVSAYMGRADSHKNGDVRGLLAPLASLAQRHRVAVLLISHLNKSEGTSAQYRIMGSLAFVAAARMGWAVAKDKEDGRRRLLLPIKSNLCKEPTGLAYTLADDTARPGYNGQPVVAWEGTPITEGLDELLRPDTGNQRGNRKEAAEWLKAALADGPVASATLVEDASESSGISRRTLFRAKDDAGIRAKRVGKVWEWSLPQ
ncbi:MAG: AAA family ATPase [bacterium]|nr:AAA family ATPase [bacterium]